jgi:hypothetical protein
MAEGYAEDMAAGAVFPPIVVFFDGAEYWLAGFVSWSERLLTGARTDKPFKYSDIDPEELD